MWRVHPNKSLWMSSYKNNNILESIHVNLWFLIKVSATENLSTFLSNLIWEFCGTNFSNSISDFVCYHRSELIQQLVFHWKKRCPLMPGKPWDMHLSDSVSISLLHPAVEHYLKRPAASHLSPPWLQHVCVSWNSLTTIYTPLHLQQTVDTGRMGVRKVVLLTMQGDANRTREHECALLYCLTT